jgi:hypothetical protein
MIMSNRYLPAMSRWTAPISGVRGEDLRPGRHLLARQSAARRADRHPDLRIAADALDLAGGGVDLYQEPAIPRHNHTRAATLLAAFRLTAGWFRPVFGSRVASSVL